MTAIPQAALPLETPGATVPDAIAKPRDVDLDVVRGLAIVLAMGWHLNGTPTGQWLPDLLLAPGRTLGWAGVDLFFVLSGFLVGRLILREHQASGGFDYPRFFVRRALKLWPTLYLFLIAMVFASPYAWETFVPQTALHVQNFFTPSTALHLWSLAVEEHFYLLLGIGFVIFVRRPGTPEAWLFVLPVAALLFAPAARVLGHSLGADPVELQWQTQYRIDGLAAGVLLATLSVHRPALFDRLRRQKLAWALVALAACAFLWQVPKTAPLGVTLGFTVSWVAGAATLMLVFGADLGRRVPRLASALAFLGVYSYALYIWHLAAAKVATGLLAKGGLGQQPLVGIAASYAMAIAVAWLATRLIERPLLHLRDRLLPSRAAAV